MKRKVTPERKLLLDHNRKMSEKGLFTDPTILTPGRVKIKGGGKSVKRNN
jgi:hypothetical protein